MPYQLGVDLGTTHSAAAITRDGSVEVTSLGERSLSVPSVVFLTAQGMFLFGEAANRQGLFEPNRVAREFKRRIGDETPLVLGGTPFSADVLTARLLRWTVDKVVAEQGEWPTALAITHPANWGPYKLDLLRQAVDHARLGALPVSLMSEPEAAATHYATRERIEPGAAVAVYDLGGGTFDAAVLRRTDTGFDILGRPEGIERLGGIDFDTAILSHVRDVLGPTAFELDHDDVDARGAMARLRADCVDAKEALSTDAAASIRAALPTTHHTVRLTRDELEAMIRPALAETMSALRRAVDSAGITPADLQAVLLVGGSSRIPLVGRMVASELERPVATDAHPKHAVAQGAALAAARHVPAPAPPAPAASSSSPTLPPGELPPRTPPGTPRPAWQRRAWPVGVVAALVIALLGGWLVLRDDGDGGGTGTSGTSDDDTTDSQERPSATIAEQWSVDTGADLVGVTIVDDVVVTFDAVGDAAGFDRDDGTERWRTPLGGEGTGGPKLAGGLAIVQVKRSSEEAYVVALDPATGQERWRLASAPTVNDTLGVGDDVVVVPAGDGATSDGTPGQVVDARDGSTITELAPGDELGLEAADPAMVTDDLVVMSLGLTGEGGTHLVAYDRDAGGIVWEQSFSDGAWATVPGDGVMIRAVDGDTATEYQAVDVESGGERWSIELDGPRGDPPVTDGGLVVLNHSSGDTGLVAVDPETGDEAWNVTGLGPTTVAALDDLLVAAGLELTVHDLAAGTQLTSIDLPEGLKVMDTAEDVAVVGSGRTLGAYAVERELSLREAWQFSDSGSVLSGTGVAAGDVVVVGNDRREVVAVDRATGEERWRSPRFDEVDASGNLLQPTVAGDLVLVATGDDDTEVVALSLDDGEEAWRVPVDSASGQVHTATAGGLVVLGVEPLQGVDPETGDVVWRRGNAYPSDSAGALGTDGTTVVTAGETELAAYDGATGQPRWRSTLPLEVYSDDELTLNGTSGFTVSEDRVVISLTTGGLAVDRIQARSMTDGSQLWEADVPGGAGSVAVGDGVVVTNPGEQIVALDLATGDPAWEAAGRDSVSSVAVGDGAVVVWGVRVLLVDASTGEVIDEVSTVEDEAAAPLFFGPPTVSPVVADGLVVVQSADDTLLAYQL